MYLSNEPRFILTNWRQKHAIISILRQFLFWNDLGSLGVNETVAWLILVSQLCRLNVANGIAASVICPQMIIFIFCDVSYHQLMVTSNNLSGRERKWACNMNVFCIGILFHSIGPNSLLKVLADLVLHQEFVIEIPVWVLDTKGLIVVFFFFFEQTRRPNLFE